MDVTQKIEYWIDIAKDDLNTARVLLDNKIYLQSCFYCHQTIEKTLKAYYWFAKQKEPDYTHNLLKLASTSELYDKLTDVQKDFIDKLMPFNIEARYPIDKQRLSLELNHYKTKIILDQIKELLEWIIQSWKK